MTSNDVAEVFNRLHDGVVVDSLAEGNDLTLRIGIRSLAERMVPGSGVFVLKLHEVRELIFFPWGIQGEADPAPVTMRDEVLSQPLELVSAEVVDGRIEVTCTCGTLRLRTAGGEVWHESGVPCTLGDLQALADGYWREFAERAKERASRDP